jgi:hypothetical protein
VWGCGGVGSLLTFDIPQTALVATLDTYDLLNEVVRKLTTCSLIHFFKQLPDLWHL